MKNANTTAKKSSKKSAAAAELQFNMQVSADEIDLSSDDAVLSAMLAGLEEPTAEVEVEIEAIADEEVIEHSIEAADPIVEEDEALEAIADEEFDDEAFEAALADIEKTEAIQAIYNEQDAPVADGSDAPQTEAVVAKKEKKAKVPTTPRVTYVGHKPSEVLVARLGEKIAEMLLLEVGDVELEPAALEAKQAELLKLLNARPGTSETGSTQKKVAEKIVMLFGWMKNGGSLNEVMRRTFMVLARDGEIVSGDKGNLHAELLSKPYSVQTCRAQAGQMMAMLPMLKIANKAEKGKLVANPDSLLFMKAKADLGL